MMSLVWTTHSWARTWSACARTRTAMKTAWTSSGTAMRVRPFLKIVNRVFMVIEGQAPRAPGRVEDWPVAPASLGGPGDGRHLLSGIAAGPPVVGRSPAVGDA